MMTRRAPASASISAQMSPVKAPGDLRMQVLGADLDGRLGEPPAIRSIRVAGGQITTRAGAGALASASATASASASERSTPFIFQLPTIRGREGDVMARL